MKKERLRNKIERNYEGWDLPRNKENDKDPKNNGTNKRSKEKRRKKSSNEIQEDRMPSKKKRKLDLKIERKENRMFKE